MLWIGRISREKRFEWLLDVAKKYPDITFDVIGMANHHSEYSSDLIRRSSGIRNVKIHGRIPHAQVFSYYRRSRILCCTSVYEGFPNTFLEAWSCGIPVVSTFDPDGVIAKYGLGWTASSIDEIVDRVNTVMTSPEKWHAASRAALSYYLKHHTMDATMPKFEKLFSDVNKG